VESIGHDILVEDQPSLYERILKRKDGTTLPVEISASIVYDEDNQPAYIQSVARDISERKYSKQMLQKTRPDTFRDQRRNRAFIAFLQY